MFLIIISKFRFRISSGLKSKVSLLFKDIQVHEIISGISEKDASF